MSSYLARLRALPPQKRPPQELTQLTQAPSVSSVSDQGRHISPLVPTSVSSVSALDSPSSFGGNDGVDQPQVAFGIERRRCIANRCCACGEAAVFATNWFLHLPEKARWYCGACYRAEGRA